MTTTQFIDQISAIAINAGARALIIDMIDALLDLPDPDKVEEEKDELAQAKYDEGLQAGKEDMWQDIYNLLTDIQIDGVSEDQMGAILIAVERVKP